MLQTMCKSCQWIEKPTMVIGGVLPVGKHSKWRVNHYQSSEAILGWLVLQPVEHQPTLDKLSDETLDDLGSALGNVVAVYAIDQGQQPGRLTLVDSDKSTVAQPRQLGLGKRAESYERGLE